MQFDKLERVFRELQYLYFTMNGYNIKLKENSFEHFEVQFYTVEDNNIVFKDQDEVINYV